MTKPLRTVVLVVVLLAAAAALRFHRLGDWSFASDEVATSYETRSLFEGEGDPDSVYHALPRLIPLGYVPLQVCRVWFGESEWTARLAPAVMGSLTVALCFLLVGRSLGAWVGFFTAAIVGLLPDHVYQSQYHRFYAMADLWGWSSLALGGWAASRRSFAFVFLAVVLSAAAVLTHAIWTAAAGGMVVALVAARLGDRSAASRGMLVTALAGLALIGAWGVLWVYPRAGALNEGATWGYSPARAVLALVSQLSWPVALVAAVGFVWTASRRSAEGTYWLVLALTAGGAVLVLPRFVVYHPHYGLLLSFPWIVMAAMGAEAVRRALWAAARPAAWAWTAAVVLLPVPGLVSYYADGSRYPYGDAAVYLSGTISAADRIACDAAGVLQHYLGPDDPVEALPAADRVARLSALAAEARRTWVVVASGRSGLAGEVATWFGRRARHIRHFEAPRLDYYRFCVDIFLIDGSAAP